MTITDTVTDALKKMGVEGDKIAKKAIQKSAPIVYDAIKAEAPYENKSDRSWKAQREMDKMKGKKTVFKHLKDDMVLTKPTVTGEVNIGWAEDTYWRVHFVELGTVHQKSSKIHFIENTVAKEELAYLNAVEMNLRSGLGL